MSQVGTAALMLAAATLAYMVVVYAVWRARRPKAAKLPKMPRPPREPGQSRLPGLPRRNREIDEVVEMAPARLARISGKAPLEPLTELLPEADARSDPAWTADTLVAERPEPVSHASEADRAVVAQMLESMATQVTHEADLADRRGTAPIAVRIVPQIPPRTDAVATSWLGGRPRLDPGSQWPRIREVPGDFLGQFACADLPRDLWDGLGPRQGSLAFFVHPRDGDVAVVPVLDDGEPLDPPHPLGENSGFFAPAGGLRSGDLMPFVRHAFPEWRVDLVALRPGEPDPRAAEGAEDDPAHRLYRDGFDIADRAFHPFDWPSMLAMVDILAMRIDRHWRDVDAASPIETQGASLERRLVRHDAGDKDPLGREGLIQMQATLEALQAATAAAATANRDARRRAEEIVAIVRESSERLPFTATDAAAVMDALRAIGWTSVCRKPDPEGRPGAERIESLSLSLTQHHPDAPLWVHDYLSIWFDHAKHAYAADPAALTDAARARFEPWARALAAREMASIGHIPFRYVHDYDEETRATLLELPSSGLMSWAFGDTGHLVVTTRKADLAAGRWDRPLVQLSN